MCYPTVAYFLTQQFQSDTEIHLELNCLSVHPTNLSRISTRLFCSLKKYFIILDAKFSPAKAGQVGSSQKAACWEQ